MIVGAIALAASLIMAMPFTQRLEKTSLDSLFWLRHQLQQNFPNLNSGEQKSNVVILAIDEETYQQPGFKQTPRVMWTPQYAKIIDSVIKGGAKVIGFDIILPTSVESKLKGYDKPFLKTLYKYGRQGKIVLGKVQHFSKPVRPFSGHSFAVGNEKNIRLLNLGKSTDDDDGIIREVPLWFDQESRIDPSMAVELAARANGEKIRFNKQQPLIINGYNVPVTSDNTMLINFNTQANYIPSYSVADIYACSLKGDADYFERHFKNKVVLLGAVLGLEDRKKAASHFANTREGLVAPARCVIPYDANKYASTAVRDDISGVYLHAHAINNLLQGNALTEIGSVSYALLSLPLALTIAFLTLFFSPIRLSIAAIASVLLWIGVALIYFFNGTVLPLLDPIMAAAITFSATLGFCFIVADKDKRLIKRAFGLYLEPAVIDQMMEAGDSPELGGEERELTVWFSDIAGFTSISESLQPHELVEFLNKYFNAMTSIVRDHGGFVDKYVGDAIIAVFGAPQHDPQHALHAVQSALACDKRLKELEDSFNLPGNLKVAARIGINTGKMLVGNIGSSNRLNYTIMGDAVNLAARLEGVNKMYGTTIMASDTTVEQCGDEINVRELDIVRVKGKETPTTIFEPLHAAMLQNQSLLNSFSQALNNYRSRDFQAAYDQFEQLAQQGDLASEKFAIRAKNYIDKPPAANWDMVNTLDSK